MADGDNGFRVDIPVESHTLANGLRVVMSPNHDAPIVLVAVYYKVGFRLEPRGRTGFAHLFEHLMFQGSEHLEKMELVQLVQQHGGTLNGSTRYDFTNYFEVLPAHALELALWAEADRMRGPRITQAELDNQRDVVKNEIRVNVLNRPYGSFPWIDLPARAFKNWHNSHNGYGDMEDLDAASLEDARSFFESYYSPANAVLTIAGAIDTAEALRLARTYFEDIPAAPAPAQADVAEPEPAAEQRFAVTDALANNPALAVGYQTPPRDDPAYFAMGLIDRVLLQGDDGWLTQELVKRRGFSSSVDGGMNFLGNMFNAQTPLLWTAWLIHDRANTADEVLAALDGVIDRLCEDGIDEATLRRAQVKARSAYYGSLAGATVPLFGRCDLLAAFTLLDGDPERINHVDRRFLDVTAEQVRDTARRYLRRERRTVLELAPGAAPERAS